jgi:hypothetical protein
MSDSATTRNLNEIERKFEYLEKRNTIMKKVFSSKNGLHNILPTLDKERMLNQWD